MKTHFLAVLLLSSLSFVACGGDAKAGGSVTLPGADKVAEGVAALGKVTALKDSLQGMLTSIGGIKDAASAEGAKAGLDGQLSKLKGMVGELDAGKFGDVWTKGKAEVAKLAGDQLPKLLEQFKGAPDVLKVVTPYLDQLKGLFGAK